METITVSQKLELQNLAPDPTDEWQRMLKFVQFNSSDRSVMVQTTETLLARAPELVIGTYNYLLSVPETAAILGWERAQMKNTWQNAGAFLPSGLRARWEWTPVMSLPHYLFRAGKFHAGHGPRQIHTPPAYVTGSIGLVNAAFSQYMQDANLPATVIAGASAGWNKYLMAQLHLMQLGYEIAREFDSGELAIEMTLYGRLRHMAGRQTMIARVGKGATAKDLMRKFFSYYPTFVRMP